MALQSLAATLHEMSLSRSVAGLMLWHIKHHYVSWGDRLLLVNEQVAHARRASFQGRRALLPSSTAAVSGHLVAHPGGQPLTLAQSDPMVAASGVDRDGSCGEDHAANNQHSGSLNGDSAVGTYAAFADDSTDRGTLALYSGFA